MSKQGNAVTFALGTLEITTIEQTPISVKLVVNEGSLTKGVTAVEAPGNVVGTMHAAGATKYGITASCYVSRTVTGNPTAMLDFSEGDYVTAHLKNDTLEITGEFLVEKLDVSFGTNKETSIDLSLLCNGTPTVNTIGAVSHS